MKYYADYFNERVYSVAPNGDAVCKRQIITTGQIVVNKFKRTNDSAWLWEGNGVSDYVEPMTADEFDSFGNEWVWSETPDDAERHKHSWRNFRKNI